MKYFTSIAPKFLTATFHDYLNSKFLKRRTHIYHGRRNSSFPLLLLLL
jgi:hypothetical protein